MGQLNIKDDGLIADAKALAELLGTSTTGALREAVRDRLAQEHARRRRADERFVDELLALGRRTAALLPPHLRNSDHSDLYDEHGLPK